MRPLPYTAARWIYSEDKKALDKFKEEQAQNVVLDSRGNPTLLLDYDWRLKFHEERNPALKFAKIAEAQ